MVLDLESGATKTLPMRVGFSDMLVEGRPACRPFGITWSKEDLFIVNNRQLHVFDKRLSYVSTLPIRLQINTHQLAYHEGRVWVVSPWTNSLIGVCPQGNVNPVELDLLRQVLRPYVSTEADEHGDQCHFNSVLWADEYLFVGAHAFGAGSFINRYDRISLAFDGILRGAGLSIHGLAYSRGELFWISSRTREIRSDSGYCLTLPKPGYPRGFAMTDQHFIVATSEFLARGDRYAGDSWIQVIERPKGGVAAEYHLANTGSINDLRLLDEYDYAHSADPFLTGSDRKLI